MLLACFCELCILPAYVRVFILECLSLFVTAVTFLFPLKIKTQLAQPSSEQYGIKCVFFFFFGVCMRCIRVCAHGGRAIKGAVWWRDCIKRSERGNGVAGS